LTTATPLKGLYKPSVDAKQTFGLCIYGRGGTGKTTLLGTMPGKGLIIDVPQIEGGTFVLEDKADRIDIVPVETWDEVQPIYWYLKKEKHDYRWVAIDSITAFQELAKRKVVKERDTALNADPHTITLQEWGKMGQLVGELVYQFRLLPLHTIWVAQERSHGSDEGGRIVGPDIIPSALAALMPSMMIVGRLSVQQTEDASWARILRVGPHPDYYTKVRAKPGLEVPSVIARPDIGSILRFLLGSGPAPEAATEPTIVVLG
jgi:phage nucleotide-binding protein